MIHTILWFIAFGVYLIMTLISDFHYWILGKMGMKEKQEKLLYKVTTNWARTMVKLTGSSIHVTGEENIPEGNVLFVSNHQGNFDIPVLLGYLPKGKGFVAKIELRKIPILSGWMKKLGCLFLDRKDPRQSLKVIIEGIDLLKKGHTLVVFPEGTRSKGNPMAEFKKGSMKLATKSGVPIVPVTIDGTYRMLEEKNKIKKANVNVKIHAPIYMNDLTKEEKSDLSNKVYNIIQSGF